MPYALFPNYARLSKVYPTEADVWKVARTSGLVVDVAAEEERRTHTRCWTIITRLGPAIPSQMKEPKKPKQAKAKGGAA